MWHTISELKKKYVGKEAVIAGTGPSADAFNSLSFEKQRGKTIYIAINRAVCLSDDFDFVFVDHPETLRIIEDDIWCSHCRVCMPWYSRGILNINDPIANKHREALFLYAWVYEQESLLDDLDNAKYPDQSINDALLYISYGNAQSILHFCKLTGIEKTTVVGCDGGAVDGRYYSNKVLENYPELKNVGKKRERNYQKINGKILDITNRLGIILEVYTGEHSVK